MKYSALMVTGLALTLLTHLGSSQTLAGTQRYIVRFKDSVPAAARKPFPEHAHVQRMANMPLAIVDATPADLQQIRAQQDVDLIAPDHPLGAKSDLIADTINASVVWKFTGFTGGGV